MYTTSETLRLSLTIAQMLDYMTDNHINDILMFQQFLLLHTFLGVSKSLPTQSVQGPKKYFVFLDPSYKTVQLIKLTLCSNFSGCSLKEKLGKCEDGLFHHRNKTQEYDYDIKRFQTKRKRMMQDFE